MKMKKIKFLILILTIGIASSAQAQSYKNAIGIRLGDPSGITFQHYFDHSSAFEGILGLGGHWFTLTGLYEYHQKFEGGQGLGWYIGFGAHIGSFDNNGYDYNGYHYNNGGAIFGIDGILGLDYTIPNAPINLSLDWKPAVELSPSSIVFPGEFGLSVRYTFGR